MEKVAACKCYEISIGVSPDVGKVDICKETFGEDLLSLQKFCHRFDNPGRDLMSSAGDEEIMDAISEVADDCRGEYIRAFMESRFDDYNDHHNSNHASKVAVDTNLSTEERLTIIIRFKRVTIIIYF